MSKEIASYLSEKTHTPITIQGVDISPFKSVVLKGLYAEDYQKDTLCYIQNLDIKLDSFNLEKHKVYVNTLTLDKTYFRLHDGKGDVLNIEVFLDSLLKKKTVKKQDTLQKPWVIDVANIDVKNSSFAYKTIDYIPQRFGMNYDDIYVENLNVQARNIQIIGDSVRFDVKHFSCLEKSGFDLKELSAVMWITNHQWGLSGVKIKSRHSNLKAKYLYFNYTPGEACWGNFIKKMKLDFLITSSNVSFLDVAYFNENLLGFREKGFVSGHIYGTIFDLRGRNLNIVYGDNTSIKGRFYMNGLPDLNNTYLEADFKQLTTSVSDIQKVYIPGYAKEHFRLPELFNNLGLIKYKGKFNGFFTDFVFYGDFDTHLGSLKTDILFKPQKGTNKLNFSGDVATENFNLGGFLNQKKVGSVTMNVSVNGYSETNNAAGTVKGNIRKLDFYGYDYENVVLNGFFANSVFDGKLSVQDPNVNFNFSGRVDFSKEIPEMNFSSNLLMAKLNPLHLNVDDKKSSLNFAISSDLKGRDFDNLNGTVRVNSAVYTNSLGSLPIKQLTLSAATSPKYKRISLDSDYGKVNVEGNYSVKNLMTTIKNLIYNYLPAYAEDSSYMQPDTINKFKFLVQLKDTKQLSKVLYPEVKLAKETELEGEINAEEQLCNIKFNTKNLKYKDREFKHLKISADANKERLLLRTKMDKLNLLSNYGVYNFSPKIKVQNNTIKLDVLWNNWGNTTFSGSIGAVGKVQKIKESKNKKWDIIVNKGTIVMADSVWTIPKSKIQIDSSSCYVENFRVGRNNEFFSLSGKISENKQDSINMKVRNIALKSLNAIFMSKNIGVEGVINGELKLLDVYGTPIVDSHINTQQLIVNNDTIGNVILHSEWDKQNSKISIQGSVENKIQQTIKMEGDFYPEDSNFDIDILLNNMNLKFIQPYMEENISELSGALSGALLLTGNMEQLKSEGHLKLNNVGLKVNATQAKYWCNDSIFMSSDKITFNNFKIVDAQNNKARLNGEVDYGDFDKVKLNLTANFKEFEVLNSTITDNEMFYGKAFVSGVSRLWGNTANLNVDINVKTENNTAVYIPMNTESDLQESDFISFINTSKNIEQKTDDYNVDLFGANLNCDLEITPNTSVQIIFDSKIGDILKAQGAGNLKMQIDKKGDFKMYGDYTIKKGSYLFTLQNVINKKFDLANGGTIKWAGNPYDARIDINAVYKVKTTLYDLILNTPYVDKTKKIPVECNMNLSKSLESPIIKFGIDFPTLDQQTQSILSGVFGSEDEVNKQILSLLVLNRFYTPEYMRATDPDFQNKNSSYAVGATAGELFSNQLSNWLSQISNNFDIGFTWRPGDDITKDEVELALSTQIFNDRVTINGNVGTRNNQTASSNFVGDVDVNVKLDKSGKLQFKAFTRSNEYLLYEENRNTQGVGIFYKEDFNTWGELFRKYLRIFKRKKKQKPTNTQKQKTK